MDESQMILYALCRDPWKLKSNSFDTQDIEVPVRVCILIQTEKCFYKYSDFFFAFLSAKQHLANTLSINTNLNGTDVKLLISELLLINRLIQNYNILLHLWR